MMPRYPAPVRPLPSPGPMLAVGFFLVAAFHLAFAYFVVNPQEMFSIIDRLPGLLLIAGGVVIAIGWGRACAYPRGDLRTVGSLGIAAGVGIAVLGCLSMITTWLLYGFDYGRWLWAWVEIATCALTVAGTFLWLRAKSTWMILAGLAIGAHAVAMFSFSSSAGDRDAFVNLGVIPTSAWVITGIAALAMRPGRAHVPAAVVVER